MSTLELQNHVTFKNVLVATDFSDVSKRALEWAAGVTDGDHGQVFVLHVIPSEARLPVPLDPLLESLERSFSEARHKLEDFASSGVLAHARHQEILETGPVWDAVADIIQHNQIDLLVVGTHGRTGLRKFMLGSVAEELFRRAPCPVLTIGPAVEQSREINRVLFATDFGASSAQALPYAEDFANKSGGELTLLNLVSPQPVEYVGPFWYPGNDVLEVEEANRRNAMKKLQDLVPANSGLRCKVGHVVDIQVPPVGILNCAAQRDADLIVMGVKKSNAGAARFAAHAPWATAYEVVCRAHCPVLTVRS